MLSATDGVEGFCYSSDPKISSSAVRPNTSLLVVLINYSCFSLNKFTNAMSSFIVYLTSSSGETKFGNSTIPSCKKPMSFSI
jgi:hypothetical protein